MKNNKQYIVGISGSLRSESSNTSILRAIGNMTSPGFDFKIYKGIDTLPHFNPELDKENSIAPESVQAFRRQIKEADAIIICTPEYASGIPGVLKNALDWIVSSGELVDKPMAAISASPSMSGGQIALTSLVGTLRIMTANLPDTTILSIPLISKKLTNGTLDEETTRQLKQLTEELIKNIHKKSHRL